MEYMKLVYDRTAATLIPISAHVDPGMHDYYKFPMGFSIITMRQ